MFQSDDFDDVSSKLFSCRIRNATFISLYISLFYFKMHEGVTIYVCIVH